MYDFKRNKYLKWYDELLTKEWESDTHERHHSVPKCLGGKNSRVVKLSPRAHFVAHRLLTKIVKDEDVHKMYYALACFMMSNKYQNRKLNSREYEVARRAASIAGKGKAKPVGFGDKISAANTGKKLSKETRQKISSAKKGVKRDPKSIAKSAETCRRNWTPEKRAAYSRKQLALWTEERRVEMSVKIRSLYPAKPKPDPKHRDYFGDNNPMWGRRHGVSAKLKMSAKKIGVYDGEKNPMFGKIHSDSARQKISDDRRGRKWINMNGAAKSVKTEELESYVLAGWELGRVGRSRTFV